MDHLKQKDDSLGASLLDLCKEVIGLKRLFIKHQELQEESFKKSLNQLGREVQELKKEQGLLVIGLANDLIDQVENIIRHENSAADESYRHLLKTLRQELEIILRRLGVKPFIVSPNDEYQAARHSPVNTLSSPIFDECLIVEKQYERGYVSSDGRIVRPAKVSIKQIKANEEDENGLSGD